MTRVLVTGGTGYVGRFIVDHLVTEGHDVTVLGRNPPARDAFLLPVGFLEGALAAPPGVEALRGFEHLVHAAFDHLPGRYRGGEGDDPAGFRARNLAGTNALFDAAAGAGVGRIVFLSSRAVYGTQPPGARLGEETRPHPDTLYGEVKLGAERHLAALSSSGRCVGTSLRVTGVYGPAGPGREDKWTPLLRGWLAGRPIASHVGTEVHGADVARAVALVLDAPRDRVSGAVFNVSDVVVDRSDIAAIAQQATGRPHPLPQPGDASRLNVMETSRLRSLGWQPGGQRLLRDTVRLLVDRLTGSAAPSR